MQPYWEPKKYIHGAGKWVAIDPHLCKKCRESMCFRMMQASRDQSDLARLRGIIWKID
jgi:hypothetical protein